MELKVNLFHCSGIVCLLSYWNSTHIYKWSCTLILEVAYDQALGLTDIEALQQYCAHQQVWCQWLAWLDYCLHSWIYNSQREKKEQNKCLILHGIQFEALHILRWMSGDYELNFHLELQLQSMSITSIHKSSPGYLTLRTSICICLWAAMDSHCLELFVNTLVYEGLHFGLLLIDPVIVIIR